MPPIRLRYLLRMAKRLERYSRRIKGSVWCGDRASLVNPRMTKNEREVIDKLRGMRIDLNPPEEWVYLSVEKELLDRRVRTGGCHQTTSTSKPDPGCQLP